ncbi:MAG: DUF2442 domain-containing protein [Acidobacteria bacterium]|nr:DUF2442 domain-containing protein [Acidobacteriota bacterium]
MDYQDLEARYVRGHVHWVRLRDCTVGEIDLSSSSQGPAFDALRDLDFFEHFTIHPDVHTLLWRNGADFAPKFLHERVRVPG